jgi:hypothetical protein
VSGKQYNGAVTSVSYEREVSIEVIKQGEQLNTADMTNTYINSSHVSMLISNLGVQ